MTIYMPEFVQMIKDNYPLNVNTIVEIGALDGADSAFLHQAFPDSKGLAVEGLTSNYNSMHNVEGVTNINAIITNYIGLTPYYEKSINGIHGIRDRGLYNKDLRLDLPCITLSHLMELHYIPFIDVLKIDVEGCTYEVLDGLGEKINKVGIMHVELEDYPFFVGQYLKDKVHDQLIAGGYRLLKELGVHIANGGSQYDSVWINNNL